MVASQRELLRNALNNIATGTNIAVRLKESAQSAEVRELAKAVHFIGYGAQETILALTDEGRVKDL
ncbi:hypothetical protein FCO76_05050 [Bifidobacterium longum subsp. longum]|uniref:Uncharacterized protein n=1 Tax=Bifidobacterium longum subsp. longum TaxID=1679 RepID=A0AA46Q305_BIFLL|nr:hypothetical protein FCO76_05050 [Bifidobacterium longum subsp. longum]